MSQASSGKTGIGVLFQVSDGGTPTPTWATMANITNISAGGVSLNMVDSTHLDSPDFYKEMIPGLKTATPWTGTLQWDPNDPTLDDTTGMEKFIDDRSLETFRINPFQLGLTVSIEVDAYVNELGNIDVTPEGIMTRSFTITPVGKPRRATVSSI